MMTNYIRDVLPVREDHEETKTTTIPSKLMKEFGISNEAESLNCFLNVCLQALWQFPQVRFHLRQFSELSPSDSE